MPCNVRDEQRCRQPIQNCISEQTWHDLVRMGNINRLLPVDIEEHVVVAECSSSILVKADGGMLVAGRNELRGDGVSLLFSRQIS